MLSGSVRPSVNIDRQEKEVRRFDLTGLIETLFFTYQFRT